MTMNKVILITGPTASGKTQTSIEIAQKIQKNFNIPAVIVNFDSLLFYKEVSIGTAKPTLAERADILHFMIDIESIRSPMNAADFIKIGEAIIKEQLALGNLVILVGGSAFYLRALLKGMYQTITPTPEIKEKFENQNIETIISYLKIHDPESLNNLHINDHYRLTRAALHFEMTGTKFSSQKIVHDELSPYDFSKVIHPWDLLHIYLDLPKDQHFEIIKNRAEKMFNEGLMDEIEQLEKLGFSTSERPFNSIGYKEALEWKNGLFPSQKECVERIAISTRQLAKSQRTFFKKMTPKLCFNPLLDQEKIFHSVELFLS